MANLGCLNFFFVGLKAWFKLVPTKTYTVIYYSCAFTYVSDAQEIGKKCTDCFFLGDWCLTNQTG